MRLTFGVLLVGLTAGSAAAQDSRPGKAIAGPFRAYVVSGEAPKASAEGLLPSDRQNHGDYGRIGKFHDFVTRFGLDPVVAVISREAPPAADQPLGKLIAALDQAVEKNKLARLHAWVVFLGLKDEFHKDESQSAQIKAIEAFSDSLKLKHVPLAIDLVESERTRQHSIDAGTTLTVIVYSNLTVRARWDFTADKVLDDATVQAILAGVAKLVAAKK